MPKLKNISPAKSDFGSVESLKGASNSLDFINELSEPNHSFGIAQWGVRPDGVFIAQQQTAKRLPAAEYSTAVDRDGNIIFKKIIPSGDELLLFQSGIADNIFKEISNFWSKKDAFKKAGFLHKRGMLLYGPAGTGKTSIVSQVAKHVVMNGGIVLHCGMPRVLGGALEQVRTIEPTRPVVCIYEDIDAIIREYGEDVILSLLDGTNQVDNVLNMATTNYPERLDKRIVSRPRRFDRIHKIPAPEVSVKKEYLKRKLPKCENLNAWMNATDGLSFAALSEAVISVVCLGNSLDEAVKIMRNLEEGKPSSDEFELGGIGFGTELKN